MNEIQHKTVAFHTLGCKLNFSETSGLSRLMEKEGFEKKAFDEIADVYVINTCSVTENADKECRYLVRKIQRQAPESFVVITGCYAQLKPEEIAGIPGVDLVLGAAEKFNLPQHLKQLTKGETAKICSCDIAEVSGFNASYSLNDRTRTFLKVQDGCDYTCSFCTIPMARGKSRSDTIAHTVETVKGLAATGEVREIVLTGVNLGDFGKGPGGDSRNGRDGRDGLDAREGREGRDGRDGRAELDGRDGRDGREGLDARDGRDGRHTRDGRDGRDERDGRDGRDERDGREGRDERDGREGRDARDGREGRALQDEDFFSLIRALDEIEGIDRYRISSIEPNLLTPAMIEWVAGSKRFMPHFHIPLQSGSNRILGLMRRRYKRELYAERVRLIRSLMPHCAIGVDVIVGFPGETDEHFQETFDFLQELDISYLHVFTYSERDNTKALEITPVVPMPIRNQRNKLLRNLSYQKMQYFTRQHEGQTRRVLLEGHVRTPMMEGYTDNYIKVTTPYREEWANRIVDWKL